MVVPRLIAVMAPVLAGKTHGVAELGGMVAGAGQRCGRRERMGGIGLRA